MLVAGSSDREAVSGDVFGVRQIEQLKAATFDRGVGLGCSDLCLQVSVSSLDGAESKLQFQMSIARTLGKLDKSTHTNLTRHRIISTGVLTMF